MPKQAFQPEGMATPKPPYSPVVVSDDMVWTAGQVANGPDGQLVEGGITEQTRQCLENVRTCLAAVGCTLDDVVKVNTYIADLGDIAAYNEVIAVGRARGVALPADALDRMLAFNRNAPATMKASMALDLERGNRIELPWLGGKVVELGRQLGVPTPTHALMYAALKPYVMGTPA